MRLELSKEELEEGYKTMKDGDVWTLELVNNQTLLLRLRK